MSQDLKKPIIIDLGSSEIKAGFFDNSSPTIRFKNIIGDALSKRNKSLLNKEHYISSECDKYYNDLSIRYPIKRGVFTKDINKIRIKYSTNEGASFINNRTNK